MNLNQSEISSRMNSNQFELGICEICVETNPNLFETSFIFVTGEAIESKSFWIQKRSIRFLNLDQWKVCHWVKPVKIFTDLIHISHTSHWFKSRERDRNLWNQCRNQWESILISPHLSEKNIQSYLKQSDWILVKARFPVEWIRARNLWNLCRNQSELIRNKFCFCYRQSDWIQVILNSKAINPLSKFKSVRSVPLSQTGENLYRFDSHQWHFSLIQI